MRVCIIIADSNGGYPVPATKGGAVSTLVEHLVRENNERLLVGMTIVSFSDKKTEEYAKEKYPNIKFEWVRRPLLVRYLDKLALYTIKCFFPNKKILSFMSICSLLWFIWWTSRFLKREEFDKVVLQNNIPLSWTIKLSGYQGDFYYHLHNTPRTNARCKNVFEQCKAFLCVSQSVGNDISRIDNPIGPISHDKIRVVYNCVDTKHFCKKEIDRQSLQVRFGINIDKRIILFVGRLSEEKGIDQLLLALDYVEKNDCIVLIVGSLMYNNNLKDDYQEKIKQLAEKHKGKVVFTGFISQQELPEIYNLADISVLPSMWYEPAGLTMIESLACGTPVITTKSGGIPEYVKGGAVVLDRNQNLPSEIAKHIDLLLSDKSIYREYQQKGIERVLKNFSANDYLVNFLEALR